jgi:hypothetical protein
MSSVAKEIGKRLSMDERDAVADLYLHEGYPALLKLVEELVDEQERHVLRIDSGEGAEKLMYAKLKAEGAKKLLSDMTQLKAKFRADAQRPQKV